VHPASFHIVNIIIVSFGMIIFKIDDPKAFCKGDADYPIFTYVPKGEWSTSGSMPRMANERGGRS
jgi:hypothetical protein